MTSSGSGPPTRENPSAEEATAEVGAPSDSDVVGSPTEVTIGGSLGRYVILEEAGAGGMGRVFRAHDPELRREVALKLLHTGDAGPLRADAEARMIREAQAMAQLSHPNVLPVYDVQAHGNSVFIAMEFVAGLTLRQWLSSQPRTWREVLAVFVSAGRGLAAAHLAELVHRDFKPSNVLVGEDGRVYVMDFGLVRVAGTVDPSGSAPQSGTVVHHSLTQAGMVMGTPTYMSPEQHEGRSADVRSDQYSFCVSLWVGLFGRPPFEGTLDELREAKQHPNRPVPSDRAVPAWVRRIVERGLAPAPAQRWPSMEALLAQLERAPSRSRRRWLSAGAAIVALGAGVSWLEDMRTDTSQVCRGAPDKLAEVWSETTNASTRAVLLATETPDAQDVADRVQRGIDAWGTRWASAYEEACLATNARQEQSAQVLDLRMACLERHRRDLRVLVEVLGGADAEVMVKAVPAVGSLPDVARCADIEALQTAIAPPGDPALAAEVESIDEILARAHALERAGRVMAALEAAQAALSKAESVDYRPVRLRAQFAVGQLQEKVGRFEQSRDSLVAAYDGALEVGDDELAADTSIHLVFVGFRLSDYQRAERWAADARSWVGRVGDDGRREGLLLFYLGNVVDAQGRYEEAAQHHQRSVELHTKALGPDHPSVAGSETGLGNALFALGKYSDAEKSHRRALEIWQTAWGQNHVATAGPLGNLGGVMWVQGRIEDALATTRRSLEITERAYGPKHPDMALIMGNLGIMLFHAGRLDEGEPLLRRSLALREEIYGLSHPEVAQSLGNLGSLLFAQGKLDEAEETLKRCVAMAEETMGAKHPLLTAPLGSLANTLQGQGKLAEAEAVLTRALAIGEEAYGREHPEVAITLTSLGSVQYGRQELHKARENLARAVDILGKNPGRPDIAGRANFALAITLWDVGDERRRALAHMRQAITEYEKTAPAEADSKKKAEDWLKKHDPQRKDG